MGSNALFVGTHQYHLNNAEWHLSPTIVALKRMKVEKVHDDVLSVVVSNRAVDPGHIYRLALIRQLDTLSKEGKLPFALHIYGKCASLKFYNYKGELPDHQKDAGLFPYKYHLNVENHYIDNYITEKLYDSVCAECLTFYKGASNWQTFFSANSVVELSGNNDHKDIERDIELITATIKGKRWESGLASIQADKQRVLNEYAFEPRVASIIKVAQSNCYCKDDALIRHASSQGFKQVHKEEAPFNIMKMVETSIHQCAPFLMLMSSNKYPNMYDKLCFALAKQGNMVDAFALKDPSDGNLDLFVLPQGSEKIHKNVNQHKRHIFAGLKIVTI